MQKAIKPGEYLWELISPKDKDGAACKAANGKYRVKLYLMVRPRGVGAWRRWEAGGAVHCTASHVCMRVSPGRERGEG